MDFFCVRRFFIFMRDVARHLFCFPKLLLNLENNSTLVLDFLHYKVTTVTTQFRHFLLSTNTCKFQWFSGISKSFLSSEEVDSLLSAFSNICVPKQKLSVQGRSKLTLFLLYRLLNINKIILLIKNDIY